MRKLHIVGLTLLGVFALSAYIASSAFALESVFLVGGVKPTAAVSVDNELVAGTTILFEDMKEGVDITCTAVTSEGTVGPNNLDTVTKVTISGCSGSLCSSASVEAVHLPWLTELLLVGGIFLDNVLNSGAGIPGYIADCTALGMLFNDECTSNVASADIDNGVGDIIALFTGGVESEFANCSLGGNLTGLVVGEVLILTLSGATLAVSEG